MSGFTLTRKQFDILVHIEKSKESLTQREIADLFGISRSYVSRMDKKALQKLEKALTE